MRNTYVSILAAVIMLLMTTSVSAMNAADTTGFYRWCSVRYFKAIYDGGPWCGTLNQPVGKDSSIMLYHWQNGSGEKPVKKSQLYLIHSFDKKVDLSFVRETWENGKKPERYEVGVDWHGSKAFALGVVVPVQKEECPRFGPRLCLNRTTLYLSSALDARPLLGISYTAEDGVKYEATVGQETFWFRSTKPLGKSVASELRTRFTEKENFYGGAITFYF